MVPSGALASGGGGSRGNASKSSLKYRNNTSTSHINGYRTNVTYQIDGQTKTLDDVIEVSNN